MDSDQVLSAAPWEALLSLTSLLTGRVTVDSPWSSQTFGILIHQVGQAQPLLQGCREAQMGSVVATVSRMSPHFRLPNVSAELGMGLLKCIH